MRLITPLAILALTLSPVGAFAQGKGNVGGNGNGNGGGPKADRGNGNGNGNANRGNGNGRGNGNANAQRGNNGNGNGGGNNGGGNGNGNAGGGASANLNAANPDNIYDCPPGLAKKDPPCVPPGLARQGVTFEEWTGYTDEDIDRLIDEGDEIVVDVDPDDTLLWSQDEIIEVFDLDPAPDGTRYAVIDGNVVALEDDSYIILQQLRTLSEPVTLADGLSIAPEVVLDEDELVAIYGLDDPTDDRRYAVIDGELVALPTAGYDLLQLLRYTAAI